MPWEAQDRIICGGQACRSVQKLGPLERVQSRLRRTLTASRNMGVLAAEMLKQLITETLMVPLTVMARHKRRESRTAFCPRTRSTCHEG